MSLDPEDRLSLAAAARRGVGWRTRVYLVRFDDGSSRTCYAASPEKAVETMERWVARHGFTFRPVSAELPPKRPAPRG